MGIKGLAVDGQVRAGLCGSFSREVRLQRASCVGCQVTVDL